MNLDPAADVREASPVSTSFRAVPRGIGIHFDPSAPGATAVADPPASPAGTGATTDPAAPSAAGRVADPPTASPESQNIRQLREQYEGLKREYEPWQKLNAKPDDVVRQTSTYQRLETEALTLGEKLGYDANEVRQFFGEDPVKVLAYLRQQAQTHEKENPPSPVDLRKEIQKRVEESLKPITDRENNRLIKEAEFRFDGEFDRLFKDNFKDGLPDEPKAALYEMVAQLVGEDADACKRLKLEGQVSDVGKYFETAKTRLLKIYTAWSAHERKAAGIKGPELPTGEKPASKMDKKLSTGQTVRELMNA